MTKMSRALYRNELSGVHRQKQSRQTDIYLNNNSFKFLVGVGTANSVQ
jgi:hypothetical protein